MGCIITVGSVTYAIKARDILRKKGIPASIEKGSSPKGCSYSVKVGGSCENAVALLNNSGIKAVDVK